jgi:hypothetical protein
MRWPCAARTRSQILCCAQQSDCSGVFDSATGVWSGKGVQFLVGFERLCSSMLRASDGVARDNMRCDAQRLYRWADVHLRARRRSDSVAIQAHNRRWSVRQGRKDLWLMTAI